ncbi:hypothetical protein V6N12_016006 [Hibiscus sabdariffa]|uniref:Uncharacterized protein n=1 Tax=Hibiscus sabdariffa TaxID=183260 RepID=A0ABR2DRB4_9ROSI
MKLGRFSPFCPDPGSEFPGLAVSIDRVSRVRIVLNGDSNNGIPKQWPAFSFTAISIDEAEFMVLSHS